MSTSKRYSVSSSIPAFERATVADVMRPGIISCPASASLETVAQTMTAHNIHALVISDMAPGPSAGDGLTWSLVTDMDLIRAAPAGIRGRRARDVTRSEAVGIEMSTRLATAASVMINNDTAHLVVTDGGQPVGMVSTLDLAASLALGGQ